jgi:hypothetical protein
MQRLVPLAFAFVVLLVAPGAASAKELTQVQLCGPAGCTSVTDRQMLRRIPTGGETTASPPPASSFYTMRMTVDAEGEKHAWTVFYVPAPNMVAAPDESGRITWFPIFGEEATRLMKRLVAGVRPYPEPEITGATVDGKRVAGDAGSYLELFAVEPAGEAIPKEADWVSIKLTSKDPSPWTNAGSSLAYSRSAKLLERGFDLIRLPDALAADVESARPLGTDGRLLLPWLVLAGLVAAVLALAALGALGRRRWRLEQTPVSRPTAS